LKPRSPYGASKAASRHIIKVYRESFNLFAIQGWTFNFESPIRQNIYLTRKVTEGIAKIYNQVKNGENITPIALGNLDAKRAWQYAGDVADGIWLMLNQEKPKEYILSSNETHSVREFIEEAFKVAGLNIYQSKGGFAANDGAEYYLDCDDSDYSGDPVIVIDPKFYRPAEVDLLLGDSTPARKELGWSPKVGFKKLVELMVLNDLKCAAN